MSREWDVVPISQVARKVSRPVSVDGSTEYRLLGAHWYAKGLYVKEEKPGIEIRAGKLFAVKPGDFVYNRLFAWKGSFAVAQPEHEGCFVSNEFPCFDLDRERISPKFLWLYFSRESAWLEALGLSSGSTPTSRNRLKEGQFLQMQIPLPPLDEQRRIVARIEELAALIEEARDLRAKAREEAGGLLASASFQLFSTAAVSSSNRAIGDTISFRSDLIRPTDGESGPLRFVGLQHIESHTGRRIGEDRLLAEELGGRKFRFSPREIVYGYLRPYLNKVWIADCEGVCSVDQYVIRPDPEMVGTKYLAHFMRSPVFLNQAIELTHNLLLPRLRKGLLESISIPVPPICEQRRIVAYLDSLQAQVDELTALQDATQAELDALLPAVLDRAFRGQL